MEQKKDIKDKDIKSSLIEAAKELEFEAKESVEKEINDISFEDVRIILKKLESLNISDVTFPKGIDKYKGEKRQFNIVFLFHKLKYICFKKGIPACFLLVDIKGLTIIHNIESNQLFGVGFPVLNTNELMNFVFLKIFRTGEQNNVYQKDENSYLLSYKKSYPVLKFDKNILDHPMKPPENDLEKLFVKYMILMNSEWKNENYLKFVELYKQYKFDDFEIDFCNLLIKNVSEKQKEYLTKMYKNIDFDSLTLKDKTFFIENETVKEEDISAFIRNISINHVKNAKTNKDEYILEESNKKILISIICAFLNSEGGRIYIGINKEKQVFGIQLNNKQKDIVNGILYNMLRDLQPSVRNSEIKIYFIPIKNNNGEFIENLYVIKIIVPQGNINELYSIEWKKYKSFMIENNTVISLDCQKIKDEIIKRFKKEKKAIDNSIFNDKEPEQAIFPKFNPKKLKKVSYHNMNFKYNKNKKYHKYGK